MYLSIVFFAYLKIALRVIAYGTYIGSLGSNNDVTAVAAFPYLDSALFKYLGSLHIFKQCTVALLVMLFNSAYSSELCGKLCKALFLGGLGKLLVHICPLAVLAVSGSADSPIIALSIESDIASITLPESAGAAFLWFWLKIKKTNIKIIIMSVAIIKPIKLNLILLVLLSEVLDIIVHHPAINDLFCVYYTLKT